MSRSSTQGKADLLDYISWRVDGGAKPRSTARQLSSFRRFYRYLLREGVIAEDPTADIAMPKIGRSLPQSLTEEEVDSLLAAPNVSEPLGNRDRAMLELLYATGVRVSELINLKMSQMNLNQGVIRIVGKGDRERLIPLGDEAQDWLRDFIDGARIEILLERQTDYLFPDAARRPHDAPGFLAHHQTLCEESRCEEKALSAYGTPRLRDASPEQRRRSSGCPDVARPQRRIDHADLHARGAGTPEGPPFSAPSEGLTAPARCSDSVRIVLQISELRDL